MMERTIRGGLVHGDWDLSLPHHNMQIPFPICENQRFHISQILAEILPSFCYLIRPVVIILDKDC